MSNFTRIVKKQKNSENFMCVKFGIHFLGLQKELFFGVTTDDLLHL